MEEKIVQHILRNVIDNKGYEEAKDYVNIKMDRLSAIISYAMLHQKEGVIEYIKASLKVLASMKTFEYENNDEKFFAVAFIIKELLKEDSALYERFEQPLKNILESFKEYFYENMEDKSINKKIQCLYKILKELTEVSTAFTPLLHKLLQEDREIYNYFIRGFEYNEKGYKWVSKHVKEANISEKYLLDTLLDKQQLGFTGREGYGRYYEEECREVLENYVNNLSEEELLKRHFTNKDITPIELVIWGSAIRVNKCESQREFVRKAFEQLIKDTPFKSLSKEEVNYFIQEIKKEEIDLKQFREWNFDYKGEELTHLFSISSLLFDILQEGKNVVLAMLTGEDAGCNVLESWPQHLLNTFLGIRKDLLGIEVSKSLELIMKSTLDKAFLLLQMMGGYLEDSSIITLEIINKCYFIDDQDIIEKTLEMSENFQVAMEQFGYIDYLKLAIDKMNYHKGEAIVKLLDHKSKVITNYIETIIIKDEKVYAPLIQAYIEKGKKRFKEIALRIEKTWESEKMTNSDFVFIEETLEQYVEDNYNINNEKFIKFIPDSLFEGAYYKESRKSVPSKVIRYMVMEYMLLKEVYRIAICDKAIKIIEKASIQMVFENIYNRWLQTGAQSKEKNALIPYVVYMDTSHVLAFRKQLELWNEDARGALAAYAVKALAMNGSSIALMQVSSISQKFKNKKVRSEAAEGLEKAAEALGITKDVLEDHIVPNLGFDEKGEQILSYGSRQFRVSLGQNMDIVLRDLEKEKDIKTLPKPNQKDNENLANEAKKILSDIKKQLKETLKIQTQRLENVLMTGRMWDKTSWYELFAKNPIMYRFAIGLIWGVYDKDEKLQITLRYMEDGTFNTVDEEEYTLNDNDMLTFIHPCEISKDLCDEWKKCLEDYEIIQPIIQLQLPVYHIDDKDLEGYRLPKYDKKDTTYGKLVGMQSKYGWQTGAVVDGGAIEFFYISNDSLDIEIFFIIGRDCDGIYMGAHYDESGSIDGIYFTKKGMIDKKDYYYKETMEKASYKVKEVKEKIVQMALYQLSNL